MPLRTISWSLTFALAFAIAIATSSLPGEDATAHLREKGFGQAWIESLTERGTPRVYSGDELRFIGQVVGGQYAGQVYIGGDGRLWYWDIFNQRVLDPGGPGDKFYNQPMRPDDYRSIQQGVLLEYGKGDAANAVLLDGRAFADVRFRGEYPLAKISMKDAQIPFDVAVEAFSPFCPTNSADSSFPAVILSYQITNTADHSVTIRVGGWLENASFRQSRQKNPQEIRLTSRNLAKTTGVVLTGVDGSETHDSGSMAIAFLGAAGTTLDDVPPEWSRTLREAGAPTIPVGSGLVRTEEIRLEAGKSIEIRLVITWHFPNGHRGSLFPGEITRRDHQRHFYAKTFEDAGAVAEDLSVRHEQLVATTRLWNRTWYDSTLPYWFLDRTFQNASTLATTAAFRMHDSKKADLDGRIYFWEGVYLGTGNCTHVSHYEQAFGRLFPDAARAQRKITDFHAGWNDDLGYVQYRAELNIGKHFGIPHAIDGHAGTILRTYREHTTSPDDSFLRSVWPRVKRAVRFMIDQDAGRGFFADKVPSGSQNSVPDGILEGPQYHTLDKYWNGVIPWHSGMYMASLRAAAAMAERMGDGSFAEECTQIADCGGPKLAASNFNGDFGYFVHTPNHQAEYLVNTNDGCHIDQLLGDYWTHQVHLPRVFPEAQARSALAKLFEHNLYARVGDYRKTSIIPCARFYAADDEPGFFICTFPHGGARNAVPEGTQGWDALVAGYFSECMTGFTYQAAAHMISERLVLQGLSLCRAIHDRYAESPMRRNPFNEIEYGNHYTRAMASYAAFVAITGFEYDGPRGHIGFAPRLTPEKFEAAFTAAEGWGSYAQQINDGRLDATITVAWGDVALQSISLDVGDRIISNVVVDGETVPFDQTDGRLRIRLPEKRCLTEGDSLTIVAE